MEGVFDRAILVIGGRHSGKITITKRIIQSTYFNEIFVITKTPSVGSFGNNLNIRAHNFDIDYIEMLIAKQQLMPGKHIALIIDGCENDLAEHMHSAIIKLLFFASRHYFVTPIFMVNTDKIFSSAMLNNCSMALYTDAQLQGLICKSRKDLHK